MEEDGFRIFEQVSFHVLTVEESLRPCREGIMCFLLECFSGIFEGWSLHALEGRGAA